MMMQGSKYIHFADPVVAQICATTWGDGIGLTYEQAANVSNIQGYFYNKGISSFNEFRFFVGVSAIKQSSLRNNPLKFIVFPPSLKSTELGTLWGVTQLISVTMNNGLETLGGHDFRECTSLPFIEFPGSVTSIGDACCYGCSSLETVVMRPTTPPALGSDSVFGYCHANLKIYVPYSADHSILNAYKSATYWSNLSGKLYELDENGNIPT